MTATTLMLLLPMLGSLGYLIFIKEVDDEVLLFTTIVAICTFLLGVIP